MPASQLGDWSFGSGQAGVNTGSHPEETVVTILQGLSERAAKDSVEVVFEQGCEILTDDLNDIPAAVKIAEESDVNIVVVGDTIEQIGEENDRSNLKLTGGQQILLEALKTTGKPLVVVLINSKPLCIPWIAEHATAIVEAFNPGMRGGEALAKLLFGDNNFCGKLTVSFAREEGELPVHYQQIPGWHGSKHGLYDYSPLYPFGFGLSYTNFEYSDLKLQQEVLNPEETLKLTVNVKNTGNKEGIEIVQLYFNDIYTKLSTPEKTMLDFKRIKLNPSEEKQVVFEVAYDRFGYVGSQEETIYEEGAIAVMVGASSANNDLLSAEFLLKN